MLGKTKELEAKIEELYRDQFSDKARINMLESMIYRLYNNEPLSTGQEITLIQILEKKHLEFNPFNEINNDNK